MKTKSDKLSAILVELKYHRDSLDRIEGKIDTVSEVAYKNRDDIRDAKSTIKGMKILASIVAGAIGLWFSVKKFVIGG